MTTQTERQQLELAAKAAGIEWTDGPNGEMMVAPHVKGMAGYRKPWNPRDDDGDALRLALECGLEVSERQARWVPSFSLPPRCVIQVEGNDPYAATRLAIVRAAVEIGKAMK